MGFKRTTSNCASAYMASFLYNIGHIAVVAPRILGPTSNAPTGGAAAPQISDDMLPTQPVRQITASAAPSNARSRRTQGRASQRAATAAVPATATISADSDETVASAAASAPPARLPLASISQLPDSITNITVLSPLPSAHLSSRPGALTRSRIGQSATSNAESAASSQLLLPAADLSESQETPLLLRHLAASLNQAFSPRYQPATSAHRLASELKTLKHHLRRGGLSTKPDRSCSIPRVCPTSRSL